MKKFNKVATIAMSAVVAASIAAAGAGCGTGRERDGRTVIYYATAGYSIDLQVAEEQVNLYNETQGKEDGVWVELKKNIPGDAYNTYINNNIKARNAPDVVYVSCDKYHDYINRGLISEITDYFTEDELSQIDPEILTEMMVDKETMAYGDGCDELYGVITHMTPASLIYNKTALEEMGIKVISVSEEELAAFNAGGADRNGETKESLGIPSDFEIPARGFYRENAYTFIGNYNGSNWTKPEDGELMIFNDRIAMSWDEMEDIAMIMTQSRYGASDEKPSTQYGYYTEWWFSYGYGVGSTCVEDLSYNKGEWVFTLADDTPNYIVTEGNTYTGLRTGKEYAAGETLEFLDRLDIDEGDEVTAESDGSYSIGGQKVTTRADVLEKAEAGVLAELPSQREAMKRFAYHAEKQDDMSARLNIAMNPTTLGNQSATQYLGSGKVAFIQAYQNQLTTIGDIITDFEYGTALMPVYKEYSRSGEVLVQGKEATHHEMGVAGINSFSQYKDKAAKFVKWLGLSFEAFEVNATCVDSTREDAVGVARSSWIPAYNDRLVENADQYPIVEASGAFMEMAKYSYAPDWFYMTDRGWISEWSAGINNQVRNGTLDPDTWLNSVTDSANTKLLAFRKNANA